MNKVVIIGCGKIAGRWDKLDSAQSYGHASAYIKYGNFELVGCIDNDIEVAQEFAEKYSIDNVSNHYIDLIVNLQPAIISVCTPDNTHFEIVKNLLETKVASLKLIFLEKPICETYEQFEQLKELSEKMGVVIVVNHSRRFSPLYRELKNKYESSIFGSLVRADMFYYGGWRHNGVHLVDILNYLLSTNLDNLEVLEQWPSKYKDDLTLSVRASMFENKVPVWFHGFDEDNYQIFDIDLKFEKGRLRIMNFEEEIVWDTVYKNSMHEQVLKRSDLNLSCENTRPIDEAVKMISKYMETEDSNVLTGVLQDDISNTMKTVWSIDAA